MSQSIRPLKTERPLEPGFPWLTYTVAVLAGIGLALTRMTVSLLPQGAVPLGNDAFYHGARIIEIAQDPSSLHQFEALIQWPDGVWLVWPWAYDYLIGLLAGLFAQDAAGIIRIAVFSPLAWLSASILAVTLIAHRVFMPRMAALCTFAFAVSPMTVSLHGVGAIDHHSAEMFFMLMSLALLTAWLGQPEAKGRAMGLGAVLGLASAFHNGLFIIQIAILACLFLLRFRHGHVLPRRSAAWFAAGLLGAQLAVLVPSVHFRELEFAFYYLSWFHLHVATLTAMAVFAFSIADSKRAWGLLLLALLAVLPAGRQVLYGIDFVGSELPLLAIMTEAQSPYRVDRSFQDVTRFYTALIWPAPLLLAYCAVRLARSGDTGDRIAIMIFAIFGMALMLDQVRFFYFGYFFLVAIPLLAVERLRLDDTRKWLYSLLGLLLAYALSFTYYTHPVGSVRYATAWPLLHDLGKHCAAEPALALANPNWGNLIRFHASCGLIANNFIMTEADIRAQRRAYELLALAPDELLEAEPAVRYVLVSTRDPGELTRHLLSDVPYAGYQLLNETRNARGEILARLFRVKPSGGP
jgi:hypothetical protein